MASFSDQQGPESTEEDAECPGCGLAIDRWPQGGYLSVKGEYYCCLDCAEGRTCACTQRERSPHIKEAA